MKEAPYDDPFFDSLAEKIQLSASAVVPMLQHLIAPASVIDVGCGRGAWLREFRIHGVTILRGLDGPHIDQSKLLIDPSQFAAVDLAGSWQIRERYDLAVCLEVAEHLPESAAKTLVDNLVGAAPVVLFSAAIPGQGGVHHVNEQWPSYWEALFASRDFRRLDPLRRRIRENQEVAWWYRQNLVLYASPEAIAKSPVLASEAEIAATVPFEWIHVKVLHGNFARLATPSGVAKELWKWAWRGIRRRLTR